MSLRRAQRGIRNLGGFAGGTSRLARPPAVLPEPDIRPGETLCPTYVGNAWNADSFVSYRLLGFDSTGTKLWFWSNGDPAFGWFSWPDLAVTSDDRGGEITSPHPEMAIGPDETVYDVGPAGDPDEWIDAIDLAGTRTRIYTDGTTNRGLQLRYNYAEDMLYALARISDPFAAQQLHRINPSTGTRTLVEADLPEAYNLAAATDGALWWVDPIDGGVLRYVDGVGFHGYYAMEVSEFSGLYPLPDGGMLLVGGNASGPPQVAVFPGTSVGPGGFLTDVEVFTCDEVTQHASYDGVTYHAHAWNQGFTAFELGDVNDPDIGIWSTE